MRILVLQLKRIGDLILTTPALVALRAAFPSAEITLVVAPSCAGLIPALPCVDRPLVFGTAAMNAKVLATLAGGRFDACLDFTGNDRSAFFALLSKAPRRVAFGAVKKGAIRKHLYTDFVETSVRETHTVDLHLSLLAPLGISPASSPVTLELPADAEARAARLVKEQGITGPYAVVHPGTARAEKYWLPERWAAVIDHCQAVRGLPCVVTGTRNGVEGEHIKHIASRLTTPFRDLTGATDLLTLAAVVKRTALLMSMDSNPVHLGAAFKTRQIALFGETNPFHWQPRHEKATILFAGNPKPLTQFSPTFVRKPLRDLSTQTVLDAIPLSRTL